MLQPGQALLARQVVHEYVHDPDAFTQGLEYDTDCSSGACKEVYWESTGAWLSQPTYTSPCACRHVHEESVVRITPVPVSHHSRFC